MRRGLHVQVSGDSLSLALAISPVPSPLSMSRFTLLTFLFAAALSYSSAAILTSLFSVRTQVTKCPFESIIILFQKWVIR